MFISAQLFNPAHWFKLTHVHSGASEIRRSSFRRMFISALQFKPVQFIPAHWFKPQSTTNFHF
jgi:hypothetical protein